MKAIPIKDIMQEHEPEYFLKGKLYVFEPCYTLRVNEPYFEKEGTKDESDLAWLEGGLIIKADTTITIEYSALIGKLCKHKDYPYIGTITPKVLYGSEHIGVYWNYEKVPLQQKDGLLNHWQRLLDLRLLVKT